MNFEKFDMVVLVVMAVAVVVMSFIFPAIGLADASTNESEIPEFNMSSDRFDFAGDFPDRPGTPSQGQLVYDNSEEDFDRNQVWLSGSDTSDGTDLAGTRNATSNDPRINLNVWSGGTLNASDEVELSSVGDRKLMTAGDWEVAVELTEMTRNDSADELSYTVEYNVKEQPTSGGGWLGRIPVVGTLFDSGATIGGVVAWLGSIIWWFAVTTVQVALNLVGMLYDVVAFIFGTASWLVGTYAAIVSAAESWVALFVSLPALFLFLEFAKLAMIAISLLPFT